MHRSIPFVACVAAILLVPPSATSGGGWWSSIRLDRPKVSVGEEATARANVMFGTSEEAEAAERGEARAFYVYLLRGFDRSIVERAMGKPFSRDWWSVGDADAYRAGRVLITVSYLNEATATAPFRLSDTVPPGEYAVMFCDAGCKQPLAGVIPTPKQLTVTSETGEASTWLRACLLFVGVAIGALILVALLRARGARSGSPGVTPRPETR